MRLPLLVILLLGVLTAAGFVFVPEALEGTSALTTTGTLASILLVMAGIASLLRWRLDGMARSYWFGIGSLMPLIPLVALDAPERFTTALSLGTGLAVAAVTIKALKGPEVDTTLKMRFTFMWLFAVALSGVLIGSLDRTGFHEVLYVSTGLVLIGLVAVLIREQRRGATNNGMWFVPTIFAIGLGPIVAIIAGKNLIGPMPAGPMRLAAAGVAIAGSVLELHHAASRHSKIALNATIARDDEMNRRLGNEAAIASQLHEVRSRVASIEGGVSVIHHSTGEDDLTIAVRTEIERLRKLVAPANQSAIGPFPVIDALRATLVVSAATQPLTFEIAEDLVALGNPDDLAQVVHGLITNAAKYASGTPIDVTATTEGDHVLVIVEDRGPGVPRGQRDLIFERGWKGASSGEGLGLGLAIARDLLAKTRGDIWVTPRPGGGARFVVSLRAWTGLVSIEGTGQVSLETESVTLTDSDRARAIRRLGGKL